MWPSFSTAHTSISAGPATSISSTWARCMSPPLISSSIQCKSLSSSTALSSPNSMPVCCHRLSKSHSTRHCSLTEHHRVCCLLWRSSEDLQDTLHQSFPFHFVLGTREGNNRYSPLTCKLSKWHLAWMLPNLKKLLADWSPSHVPVHILYNISYNTAMLMSLWYTAFESSDPNLQPTIQHVEVLLEFKSSIAPQSRWTLEHWTDHQHEGHILHWLMVSANEIKLKRNTISTPSD